MKKFTLIASFFLLLISTGCSQSSASTEKSTDNLEEYSITDFTGQKVTFPTVPEKLVALSSGDMEIIHSLGGKVVGRPTSTDKVSSEVSEIEQIGTTHEIDVEQVALLQPDVVFGHNTMNQKDISLIEGIGSKMVLTGANSIDDIKKQIHLFGEILQKEGKAIELVTQIDAKVAKMEGEQKEKPKVLIIYGAPGTYMVALPNSLSGNLLEVAGGENIAAQFTSLENYPQYAQLNAERIVIANPSYVFLMTHGDSESVKKGFLKEMQQNAAWNSIDAVVHKRIEVLPSDLFGTNPGTRVVEALDFLHEKLQSAE